MTFPNGALRQRASDKPGAAAVCHRQESGVVFLWLPRAVGSCPAAQVKKSPKVEITPTEGLRLTTEVKTEEVGSDGGDNDDGNKAVDDGSGGSKRNSNKGDSSASTGEKPAEKTGCCVM